MSFGGRLPENSHLAGRIKSHPFMHLSEILFHLGEEREHYFHAVSPPVWQTSNFAFPTLDAFRRAIADELGHHIYTRGNNPTTEILRKKLAALEGAEDALVFPSGMAAISAAVLANLKAGDHVLCVEKPYSWTKTLLTRWLPRFGVSHTFVDGRDVENFRRAAQPNTTLLILESPNSLTFELQDLRACAEFARSRGIVTCIDNTNCTPLFQRPIELGIDLSIHTGTKYLNGHSDVVCGAVCGSREQIRKIFENEFMTLGAQLPPHDAALVIRGLRTLELRLKRSFESALTIARRLEAHPRVERVLFPWLESFPQHELARRQMSGCAGLLSFYLKIEHPEEAEAFFHRLERFLLAVSWGGHESLILPAVAFHKVPGRPDSSLPFNFFRLYVGLEDPDWLWEDLQRALD